MTEESTHWLSTNHENVLRRVDMAYYGTEDKGKGRAGGISIKFATSEDAKKVYDLITNPDSGNYINSSNFGCVHSGENQTCDAIRIPPNNHRMLHIESLSRKTINCINGALSHLFDERLPWVIMRKIKEKEEMIYSRDKVEKEFSR